MYLQNSLLYKTTYLQNITIQNNISTKHYTIETMYLQNIVPFKTIYLQNIIL